jgi:hypothetical protein
MEKEDKKDEWVSLVNTLTSDIKENSVCEAKILKNIYIDKVYINIKKFVQY